MDQLIKYHEETIRRLCIQHKVKSLYAFGSIKTGKLKKDSDVDLLVSFYPMSPEDYAENYFNLVESFERLLNRPIDLVSEKSLRNPYFIQSVNKTKTRIYEA